MLSLAPAGDARRTANADRRDDNARFSYAGRQ